jgi:type VI secretion system protein
MTITLKITNKAATPPGQGLSKTLQGGGIIGRAPSADWVLIDDARVISSHHASIEQQNDGYYITDTSMNGVFLNGAQSPLGKGNRAKLHNGDRLGIGDYEIEVNLSAVIQDGFTPQLPEDLFGADIPPPAAPPPTDSPQPAPIIPEDFGLSGNRPTAGTLDALGSGEILDPLKLFDSSPRPAPANPYPPAATSSDRSPATEPQMTEKQTVDPLVLFDAPNADTPGSGPLADFDNFLQPQDTGPTPSDHTSPLQQQFAPPSAIPDDWLSPAGSPSPAPSPPPQQAAPGQAAPAQPPSLAAQQLVAAFLEGLQLQHLKIDAEELPAILRTVGQMTRLSTQEMIKTLRARSDIKSDFRVAMTTIRATENNPLKFSATADEALEKMLIHPSASYLAAVPALREAFADLQAHQLAVMAGMQAALKAALGRFEPETLEHDCEQRTRRSNFLPGMKKARQWDNFVHYYAEIAASVEEDFGSLFGEEFARVYDEQIARLKRLHDDRLP